MLQKMTWGIWQLFTLMTSFCVKLKMYGLKIYSGVMCYGNEEWCKIWRGIDLSVQNWHEEFGTFCPKHLKISKIYPLMDSFWPKHLMFELKKVQMSYVWWLWILMQNVKENWLVLSKMTWRIWQTLLMVNISPICKEIVKRKKSLCCLLIFILRKEKNRNLDCISSKQVILWH